MNKNKCVTGVFKSILIVVLLCGAASAEARDKNKRAMATHDAGSTLEYSRSAPESGSHSGKFALGFSTIQGAIPNASATSFSSSLTGFYNSDDLNSFQGFFSIPSTSGSFNIAGAVFYKRTIVENRGSGFHVGGGFGLGSLASNFAMNFTVLGGFHFELPGLPHVMVHLDGGPSFNLVNTAPTTTSSFQLSALSPALGASVVYVF